MKEAISTLDDYGRRYKWTVKVNKELKKITVEDEVTSSYVREKKGNFILIFPDTAALRKFKDRLYLLLETAYSQVQKDLSTL